MDENQFDKIVEVNIEDEMKKSYIDYAMSVIVARALPDVRDGLKPVQRRILFSMSEMNLDPSKAYRKSARIVGDTMGKYHPHGDSSIYYAMVRMAQDFSMRYMLVDGHGNFGSIDGDGAAASRYTEARMSRIALEMLSDIDKETVDFTPNYDETMKEPVVLPARLPNLLVNGSSGIAVGMATNIPPHNLGEVLDACIKVIDNHVEENRETDIEELIEIVQGPDFPTGASILGKSGVKAAYRTGRGKICVRANANIEVMKSGREQIVIDEIPYQVNKAKLIEKIADLVRDRRIDGISDIRDETDRTGMRIVIELKKDASSNIVLNQLYKYTQLQDSFGVIMLALVDNQPKLLNLKEILDLYLQHQKDVVTRRTKFDLNKCEKRAHILSGLRIALDHIDEVIAIMRSSRDPGEAKARLMESFALSEEQASAIAEMRLRTLTGLERSKIEDEFNALMIRIGELKEILADEKKLYGVIKLEMQATRDKYGDPRRTKLIPNPGEIDLEDLIDEGVNVITLTQLNYIKRTPLDTYKSQNRGGRGIVGMQTREEDVIRNMFVCSTHDLLLFFTNLGRAYKMKGYEIPEAGRTARGVAIVNLLPLSPEEKITAVIPVQSFQEGRYLAMVTKQGIMKRIELSGFSNIRKGGINAVNLREEDSLISVMLTDGEQDIFIATHNGCGVRFRETDVRVVGRNATGVKAMTLRDGDYVVSAEVIQEDDVVLNVTENGYGKRTSANEFNVQHRGGKGVKIHHITEKTGKLTGFTLVGDEEEIMLITSEGIIIRLRGKDISTFSRVSQGVKLMNLADGVQIASIAKISVEDIEEEESEEEVDRESDEEYDRESKRESERESDEDSERGSDEDSDEDSARESEDQPEDQPEDE